MQKLLKISIIILIILLLTFIPQYISNKQSGDIDNGSNPNSNIDTNISSDSSISSDEKNNLSDNDELQISEENFNSKPEILNSLEQHDKTLKTYGDINPDSEEIIKLQQTLQKYNKNISLAVWRTDNARALTYNTNQTYFSACTIKIAYVLACCKVIDNGYADENTTLTYQERHYHQGSGKIRKSNYGTTYSIQSLIELCLSISDNVAYKMLLERFGLQTYNSMVKSLDCPSLYIDRMWAAKVNVNDFITIWNEVYNYFNSNTKMSKHLKNSCTNTPFNYGTKTLTGIDYSHKSGDNFGQFAAYNDAGIVWADNTYIYAVFTNSEGTSTDINTVNTVMETVHKIMSN